MQLWCLQTVSSYVTENMCTVEWAQWWSKCMFLFPTTVPTLRGRITTTPNQSPWQLPLVIHYISETFNALAAAVLYFVCLCVCDGWGRRRRVGWLHVWPLSVLHTRLRTHTPGICLWLHTQVVWFAAAQMSARLSWFTCPTERQIQGRRWRSAGVTEVAAEVQSKKFCKPYKKIESGLKKSWYLKGKSVREESVASYLPHRNDSSMPINMFPKMLNFILIVENYIDTKP